METEKDGLVQVTEYVDSVLEIQFAKEQLEKYGVRAILKHEIGENGHYTKKVAYFREGIPCTKA